MNMLNEKLNNHSVLKMNILEYLEKNPQKSAKEIAKSLKEEKTKINRVLYLLENIVTIKGEDIKWSVNPEGLTELRNMISVIQETPQTARQLVKKLKWDKKTINRILYSKDLGFAQVVVNEEIDKVSDILAPTWKFI